jgi:Kef-type K+ transport system membrane component KefB
MDSKLVARESKLALLVIFGIGVSLLAEALGLHFIIGAYFAGIIAKQALGEVELSRSLDVLSAITFAVFAPLLFAFIGIQLNPYAIGGILSLFLVLLLVGIIGKGVGGYVGARMGRFSPSDSLLIGALLNSRGMVELVIASIVYQEGLISLSIFSVVVAIGIITTTLSAILARVFLRPGPEVTPVKQEIVPKI